MVKKNIFSLLVALFIMYLSLASGNSFKKVPLINIPHIDKIVHLIMYFTLMSVILFENRKSIKDTRMLILIALIPVCYGILMEVLQFLFTSTRTASFYDFIFNCLGVLCSALIWFYIKPVKERLVK